MRRFLNRLLGLPVAHQNLLFAYFNATVNAEITAAKADGTFSEGLSDLGGTITQVDGLGLRRGMCVCVGGGRSYIV